MMLLIGCFFVICVGSIFGTVLIGIGEFRAKLGINLGFLSIIVGFVLGIMRYRVCE